MSVGSGKFSAPPEVLEKPCLGIALQRSTSLSQQLWRWIARRSITPVRKSASPSIRRSQKKSRRSAPGFFVCTTAVFALYQLLAKIITAASRVWTLLLRPQKVYSIPDLKPLQAAAAQGPGVCHPTLVLAQTSSILHMSMMMLALADLRAHQICVHGMQLQVAVEDHREDSWDGRHTWPDRKQFMKHLPHLQFEACICIVDCHAAHAHTPSPYTMLCPSSAVPFRVRPMQVCSDAMQQRHLACPLHVLHHEAYKMG